MDIKTLQNTPPWDWPTDAGMLFQKILSDPRASFDDRLAAAGLAGDPVVINDQLADSLTAILRRSTEPEELRGTAAISLGPVLELADTDGFEDTDDTAITRRTFHRIQESLRALYFDDSAPKAVRRRTLEASVRAPQNWHQDAIRAAYSSGDREWMLTAVFAMRWVQGFDDQILEALNSADLEIHGEAVEAAGEWGLDAAWPHVKAIVLDAGAPKPLLLAAIGAAAGIRPAEAMEFLLELAESEDEEIAEAAEDAAGMAAAAGEDDAEWIH